MHVDNWENALSDVWAKTKDSSGTREGLSLVQHTKNVTMQMGQFVSLYQTELKQVTEINLTRILMYGALMHDFGKIHSGFQDMLKKGIKFGHRHEVLSLTFLELLNIPPEEKPYLAVAIALHHKDWRDLTLRSPSYFLPNLPVDEIKTITELMDGLQQDHVQGLYILLQNAERYFIDWAGIIISPYQVKDTVLKPESIYKNLCAIHDLTSSFIVGKGFNRKINRKVCYYATMIRGLILSADHLASAKAMKLDQGFVSAEEVLKGLKRSNELLYDHQKKLSQSTGSQILIAPTGSGKTEAALLWAGSIRQNKNTRGRLFFLLPYRASINAIVRRLQRDFGEDSTAAIHGKTLVQCYQILMERGYRPYEAQRAARQQESLIRLNTTPIRVCTPYQLLRTFFSPKGFEALLCLVLGGQLVFDEIHAYDPEVVAMTLVAAKFMKDVMAAECLFMSATMPSHLTDLLKKEFDIEKPVLPPIKGYKTRHRMKLLNDTILDEETVERIAEAAKNGSVLVVANRISRAILLDKKLRTVGLTNITLIHGRFCPEDRTKKEATLLSEPGKVLIATQVVEVSLDIDYDTIFTELAPLESLIQRFGRVNRKGWKQPVIVNVFTKFNEDYRPYSPYSQEHLEHVLIVLKEFFKGKPTGELDEDTIQKMLDQSYPQSLKQELLIKISQKMEEFDRYFINELIPLGVNDICTINRLRESWDDLFDGKELLPDIYLEKAIQAETPLDVANYLVTVSNSQFNGLKLEKRVWWNEDIKQYITNCEYNHEYGLIIENV
ncbi:CRISPR-associated helicase/endonuclease Cas3 [Desulfotomaculum defluvii]